MTAKGRRMLEVLVLAASFGLVAVAVTVYLTWPANSLGDYVRDRRTREQMTRLLERRIRGEPDPLTREFYQAWLAEETGDFTGAIRSFQSVREKARPGTPLHLHSALRLGLAHGRNRDLAKELATYRELITQYPGASRLSQATFYLRQGDQDQARRVLDEALARDETDGSLGTDRRFAEQLRNSLGPGRTEVDSNEK
jgi:tetratricopeptide (TPR) repeat protein